MLVWMAIIFAFSHQANSGRVTEEYFGSFNVAVRKFGHVSEYFILFNLMRWSISGTKFGTKYLALFISIVFSILYAMSDEWHQNFVPGRSASVQDVFIDSFGVILGAITYLILLKVCEFKSKKD